MWAKPTKADLKRVPKLGAQDGPTTEDVLIYLHFFLGGCDWYISEFDGEDTMFGFCILNGDTQMAEWGSVSLQELRDIKVGIMEVDTDKYWNIKPAGEIEKIRECMNGILA